LYSYGWPRTPLCQCPARRDRRATPCTTRLGHRGVSGLDVERVQRPSRVYRGARLVDSRLLSPEETSPTRRRSPSETPDRCRVQHESRIALTRPSRTSLPPGQTRLRAFVPFVRFGPGAPNWTVLEEMSAGRRACAPSERPSREVSARWVPEALTRMTGSISATARGREGLRGRRSWSPGVGADHALEHTVDLIRHPDGSMASPVGSLRAPSSSAPFLSAFTVGSRLRGAPA
jgi:hypothetical protein